MSRRPKAATAASIARSHPAASAVSRSSSTSALRRPSALDLGARLDRIAPVEVHDVAAGLRERDRRRAADAARRAGDARHAAVETKAVEHSGHRPRLPSGRVAQLSLEPVTWRVRALAAGGRTVADSRAALLVLSDGRAAGLRVPRGATSSAPRCRTPPGCRSTASPATPLLAPAHVEGILEEDEPLTRAPAQSVPPRRPARDLAPRSRDARRRDAGRVDTADGAVRDRRADALLFRAGRRAPRPARAERDRHGVAVLRAVPSGSRRASVASCTETSPGRIASPSRNCRASPVCWRSGTTSYASSDGDRPCGAGRRPAPQSATALRQRGDSEAVVGEDRRRDSRGREP